MLFWRILGICVFGVGIVFRYFYLVRWVENEVGEVGGELGAYERIGEGLMGVHSIISIDAFLLCT